jgi:hypothetical protein
MYLEHGENEQLLSDKCYCFTVVGFIQTLAESIAYHSDEPEQPGVHLYHYNSRQQPSSVSRGGSGAGGVAERRNSIVLSSFIVELEECDFILSKILREDATQTFRLLFEV